MTLNKQRILSELGNVMTQLQSADCGCMGKCYSGQGGSNPMGSTMPTYDGYGRGYCPGHGCGGGNMSGGMSCGMGGGMGGGMPYGMGGGMGSGNPCGMGGSMGGGMGSGMDRNMGGGMGGSIGSGMGGNMGGGMGSGMSYGMGGGMNRGMGSGMGGSMGSRMAGQMPGMPMQNMGETLANMMMSGRGGAKPASMPGQGGQLNGPMLIDPPNLPNSQIRVTPLTQPGGAGNMGMYNMNTGGTGMSSMGQGNPTAMMPGHNPYGQHTQMFPGVMPGNLGFDPMSVAIQMNPANQTRSPIVMMEPAITVTQAASKALGQKNTMPQHPTNQQKVSQPSQENTTPTNQAGKRQVLQGQQIANPGMANQQQIYTVQIQPRQMHGQEYKNEYNANPNAPIQQQPQRQKPIHQMDPSRNAPAYMKPNYCEYNTLGQPVHKLPGNRYDKPMPCLPQTLAGECGADLRRVKNTMSKTSIAGTITLGKTASRSQLKHIYRQYKAHSATQQNIRPAVQGGSASDGQLHSTPKYANQQRQQLQPVERVGGDTLDNNATNYQKQPTLQQVKEDQHMGDMPAQNLQAKPSVYEKCPRAIHQKEARNGIQDSEYSPYRKTTGWSFRG